MTMITSVGDGKWIKFPDRTRHVPARFGTNPAFSRTAALSLFAIVAQLSFAQRDPGVRGGAPGAGGPIPGLTANEQAMFREGIKRANQLEAVCDDCADIQLGGNNGQDPLLQTLTNSAGLGARFNADQCSI